jgi:hypothetical protein
VSAADWGVAITSLPAPAAAPRMPASPSADPRHFAAARDHEHAAAAFLVAVFLGLGKRPAAQQRVVHRV